MPDLPQEFLSRMKEELKDEYPAFLHSYEFPPRKGLHVNTLKISAEHFQKISSFSLGKQVPWARDCFYCSEEKAGGDLLHFAGLFYLQEPSAMCAAPLLEVKEGERVLDLCAAPGGKTAQIAACLSGTGLLVANEIDPRRAKILSQNVERLGISDCAVTCAPPEKLAEKFPEYFDKILVDAPCSGEGMFKKEAAAAENWSLENVRGCAFRQREILNCAEKMLRGGGRLVYSTCTFAKEEDEEQTAAFLKEHKNFSLEKQTKLLPHLFEGEGHFAAVFQKEDGGGSALKRLATPKNVPFMHAFSRFQEETLEEDAEGEILILDDGRAYLLPQDCPDFRGIRLLRLGTELGEWDGKYFRPAHALALSSKLRVKNRLDLNAEDAARYLRGESFPIEENMKGYFAVTYSGYALGFSKASGGMLKNLLPKGIRMFSKQK